MAHNLFTIESNLSDDHATPDRNWEQFLTKLAELPHYTRLGELNAGEHADFIRANFTDVIFLGTGGSSLGGQAITALTSDISPALHFMDNIDPYSFSKLFTRLELDSTAVVVTSKSGSTMETVAQLLWCLKQFKGRNISHHFTIITEPGANLLCQIAERYDIKRLDHPLDIGGRFAALSIVGELPARIAGLDVAALHQGAKQVYDDALSNGVQSSPIRAVQSIPAGELMARACIGMLISVVFPIFSAN